MKKRNTSIKAHFDTYHDYRTGKSYQQGYKNFRNQREKLFCNDLCVTHVTHHKETKIVFPRGVISRLDLKHVFDDRNLAFGVASNTRIISTVLLTPTWITNRTRCWCLI